MAPTNTRMQAAIDALTPMGFSPTIIRKNVNHLLHKVYGRSVGWPFIEADAYRVLIEHILEVQENDNGEPVLSLPPSETTPTQNNLNLPIPSECASSRHPEPLCKLSPQTPNIPPGNPTKNPIEHVQLQSSSTIEVQIGAACATSEKFAPPGFKQERKYAATKPKLKKRRACMRWNVPMDENDFVLLEPMPVEESRRVNGRRESRWDQRP